MRPIDASDGSIVLTTLSNKSVVFSNIVDVDVSVMRTDSKVSAIWAVLCGLVPSAWLGQLLDDGSWISGSPDGN